MKLLKGDAITCIIITLINIVGGLVIGVAMKNMELMKAVQTYSILTIGNGLVSQIPALLISISAGMVITRVASETSDSNLGKDVATQILAQPKAIAVSSGLLLALAAVPGLPKIPFRRLAAVAGSRGYGLFGAGKIQALEGAAEAATADRAQEPKLTVTVPLVLEVSETLSPFVNTAISEGKSFVEKLTGVRNSLYYELGVIFPPIQINGNNPLEPGGYRIWLNEVPIAKGNIRLDGVLVKSSARNLSLFGIKAEDTKHPATGKPAAWIGKESRERAM